MTRAVRRYRPTRACARRVDEGVASAGEGELVDLRRSAVSPPACALLLLDRGGVTRERRSSSRASATRATTPIAAPLRERQRGALAGRCGSGQQQALRASDRGKEGRGRCGDGPGASRSGDARNWRRAGKCPWEMPTLEAYKRLVDGWSGRSPADWLRKEAGFSERFLSPTNHGYDK